MSRHRSPEPTAVVATPDPMQVLRHIVWLVAAIDAAVAGAFLTAEAGTAPSIQFLQMVAPLPVWGGLFAAVALLLVFRLNVAGHLIAVPLWMFWGIGAVLGLVNGSTRSPASSVAFTGLVVGMCALHVIGLRYRRQMALAQAGE